jgi:hypothetical protein
MPKLTIKISSQSYENLVLVLQLAEKIRHDPKSASRWDPDGGLATVVENNPSKQVRAAIIEKALMNFCGPSLNAVRDWEEFAVELGARIAEMEG